MARKGAQKIAVRFTANFDANLAEIEQFLNEAGVPQAFDELLGELAESVIPNLESFPAIGRLFLERAVGSVEVSNGVGVLRSKLQRVGDDAELREYVLAHYLLLYVRLGDVIHLLSIRHHRQLSFDLVQIWD